MYRDQKPETRRRRPRRRRPPDIGHRHQATAAPMYRDQKPETRIPAKDILALT
jgi:hypothetical protein